MLPKDEDRSVALDATIAAIADRSIGTMSLHGLSPCTLFAPLAWEARLDAVLWHPVCTRRAFIPAGMSLDRTEDEVSQLLLELMNIAKVQLEGHLREHYIGMSVPAVYFVNGPLTGENVAKEGFEFFAYLHLRRTDDRSPGVPVAAAA